MSAHETPDELRARAEAHVAAMRRYPAVWAGKPGTADLIDALLARLAAAEAVHRPPHDAVLRVVSDLRCPSGCIQPDCSECLCEDATEQIMGLLRERPS